MTALSGTVESGLLAVAAFLISAITSTAGVSGAFLLLPLQIWILGVAGPAVSATNLLYNLVATPGGVYRYGREGRMLWSLAGLIALGALPGMLAGYWLRVHYLAGLGRFRWLVAGVLILLGLSILLDGLRRRDVPSRRAGVGELGRVRAFGLHGAKLAFAYAGRRHEISLWRLLGLSAAIGVVGGIYGVGGGALAAPFLIWLFRLPVHAISGATLGATFLTSAAGVLFYWSLPAPEGVTTAPDWRLGLLLGVGGLAGTYVGASLQKYAPQAVLKAVLGAVSLIAGARFLFG